MTDEYTEDHARQLAQRVLAGSDRSLTWREAGYRSAHDAAKALVGDAAAPPDILARATEIVADELDDERA